jgi:retron-type reverse transcriptase
MAKVINFYRESAIPAILVFRRSMDKNALKSVAIYGMPRYCTNLRVVSDYPGIFGKFSNNMRERACPPNGFKNIRTSVRTLFFIDYSNRTKYKGMRSFSSSRESKDLRFSRKFCRKTMVDVPSEIKSWIEKNSLVEKAMWTLYSNPKTKHLIFGIQNINKIRKLLMDYNYVQSLQVIKILPDLKTRVVQQNLPHEIERLQCIFMESFSISVLAVYSISKSSGASTPGVDGKYFSTIKIKRECYLNQQLIGTRYQKSGKSFKVKKDLPKNAVINDKILKQLKSELSEETLKYRFRLLQQCNLKSIRKNYKGNNICRVWIPKKNPGEYRPLGIPTLRDRILQQIIAWGISPISESQADALSFGFRSKRSATQAIAYVFRKLSKSRITRKRNRFIPKKVGKESYESFRGKKAKFQSSKTYVGKEIRKRRRVYNYDYWIYPEKKCKPILFKLYSQYYYLNVDIVKCFDKISHKTIYEKVPLANKYLFFIKRWATNFIIGPENRGGKNIKFKPTSGVPQGSIIGPMICNIVLDGLQDFVQDNLPSRYTKSKEELDYVKFKTGKEPTKSVSRTYLQVFCVRYADDILILSKCAKSHVKKIQHLLVEFLNRRGLEIKNSSVFQGKRFKPGSSIEYLGFKFKYPNLKKSSFDKGKYTKLGFNPMSVADATFSRYSRSGPYLLIQNRRLKKLKDSLKIQLNRKNSYLPVELMIDQVNAILRGALNYYNLTSSTKNQLLPLNDLLHQLFYKYLLRKFSSKPKIYTFIRTNFRNQNRFVSKSKVLLRVGDVNPFESVPLVFIAPGNEFLVANPYVD